MLRHAMFRTYIYLCFAIVTFYGFSAQAIAEEQGAAAQPAPAASDAVHELATRLIEEPTDADRAALLSSSPQLVTSSRAFGLRDCTRTDPSG